MYKIQGFCYAPAMFPLHHHVTRGPRGAHAVPLTLPMIVASLIILSTTAVGQTNYFNLRIEAIRFKNVGIGQFDEGKARKVLASRPGAPVNPRKLRADVKTLKALGYFEDVSNVVSRASDVSVFIDYEVTARPLVSEVITEGSTIFSLKEIERVTQVGPGKRLGRKMAARAAGSLMNYYRARYYYDIEIKWRVEPTADPGWVNYILNIEEGSPGVVTELTFDGNNEFTDKELRRMVSVKPNRNPFARWARNDAFYTEQLKDDYEAIRGAYRRRGYMAVKVALPDIEQIGSSSLRIAWHIEEGLWYRVETIHFEGSPGYPDDWSKKWISLQPKDLLTPRALAKAAGELQSHYRSIGYPHAEVIAKWKPIEATALADVMLEVEPGRRERVRNVTISGNDTTHDGVILREIDVKRGELYNEADAMRSRARLERLPMFEEVRAKVASAETPDECDITFAVEERNTGKVEAGVTAGSEEGAAVAFKLTEANLSFRRPFRGAGYRVSLGGEYGPEHRDANLSFRNPRFWDSRFYVSTELQYRDVEYQDDYSQRSVGATLRTGRSLGRYQRASLFYQWDQMTVYDIDPDASTLYEEETIELGAVGAQYTFNVMDRRYRPQNGIYFSIKALAGSDMLGGGTEVNSARLRSSFFWSPGFDHIVNLRMGAESIEPYGDTEEVPLPMRLFLGGSRDLRGFEAQTVSPRDEDGKEIGGRTAYFATLEYTLPMPLVSLLDVSVYYDIGNVTADAFDFDQEGAVSDAGVGLTIRAQNMPLRLDLAWPLEVSEDDTTNEEGRHRFSFAAGYNF